MKKICFALLASALLAGCSITQEMKENASFDGLETFYVAAPAGTNDVFAQTGNAAETDAALKAAVAENLKEKGFVEVSDPKEAQIVFRPLWNATHGRADFDEQQPRQAAYRPPDRHERGVGHLRDARNSG